MRQRAGTFLLLAAVVSAVLTAVTTPPAIGAETVTGTYVPMTPTRVLDTRNSGTKAAGGVPYTISLANVAFEAIAVHVNVTVVAPDGDGYITLAPGGSGLPLASNVNFVAGETTANAAIVAVSIGQDLTFMASVNAHVVLDLAGYWIRSTGATTGGRFVPIPPVRVADSRGGARLGDAGVLSLNVAAAGVPADALAVALTLTATEPTAAGYITAWGEGQVPFVSNVNYRAGQTIANFAIVPVANVGTPVLQLLASAPTHYIVDVAGYITGNSAPSSTSGQFVPATPSRVLDTRDGTGRLAPPDSVSCGDFDNWNEANDWYWTYSTFGDPFSLDANGDTIPCESLPGAPSSARPVVQANARVPRNGVIPAADPRASGASAVVFNLTVTAPSRAGFVTAYPADTARPWTSNVNPTHAGHVRPGLAIVGTGTAGTIFLYTSGPTHLVADAAGWFL